MTKELRGEHVFVYLDWKGASPRARVTEQFCKRFARLIGVGRGSAHLASMSGHVRGKGVIL